MKRILLSAPLLAISVVAFGQRPAPHGRLIDSPFGNDRGEDTVVTSGIAAGPLAIYGGPIGFVLGNNTYGDKAKAQVFDLGGDVVVDELLFLFGGKNLTSGGPANCRSC